LYYAIIISSDCLLGGVKVLAALFDIKGGQCIAAEGLDARPNDVENIMKDFIEDLANEI
jgi:hypothetical protein